MLSPRALTLLSVPLVAALVTGVAAPSLASTGTTPKIGFFELTPSAEEIPGGGDTGGQVRAYLQLDGPRNSVCYLITWTGLKGKVTAAHLHNAKAGKVGPHAVDLLNDVKLPGKRGSTATCVDANKAEHGMKADPKAVSKILAKPDRFYLNIHTSAYPDGARRAQLG